jgi:hypothetical protein
MTSSVTYRTPNPKQATALLEKMVVERFDRGEPIGREDLTQYIADRFPKVSEVDRASIEEHLSEELWSVFTYPIAD